MRIGPVLAVTSICASMSVSLLSCGGGNENNRKGPGTPQYGGKDVPTNTGRVKEQRPDILSPPIIVAPLLNCGTAVVVKGFIPGAEIRIFADGAPIGGGPSDAPWGQSFPVNPALKSPSQVTATQTFDGHTSQPSTPVPVQSVTQAYPNGLPKPGFPALPLYRCGRMTAVDSLPPGGTVRVSKGLPGSAPALAGQGSGVGASQAVRIQPEFQLNEEVTAESQICTVVSPRSDKQTVQQAPAALPAPAFDPVYDGGQYVVFRQLVNGAHVTIRRGAAVIGGDDTASSAATFRVNPPLAAGDHPEATQELCGVSSPPGTTTVLPCASLPAVHMHAPKAGDTVVRLIDPVPGSRIFIFASGEEVGDGGGPEIQLTRPLRYGEIVELVQMLGTCIASTSHQVTVGSGLSDPTERGSCKVEGWEYGRPGSPETYTTDVSSYFNSPDADVSIPMNAVPRHALVRYPVGAGPFPLVLIVHGNHIPPHEASEPGYVYLLDHLASHCMIAASVDENFLNGWVGGEMDVRAIVLLRHLQLWREWNQTPGNRWYGKVNMSALGLSGHSRGGEAITVAHLLDTLKHNPADPFHNFNFGITALYAIAPVDGQNDVAAISPVTLRNADYYVMHGTHDGDVWEFDGQRMFDRAMPVAETVERYKGLLWVYGANHGQWNTVWGTGSESVVQPVGHRISGPDQRTIGLAYITAFFLKSLRGYSEYKDFFTGEATFNSLPGARRVTQYQDPKRMFLDHYEEDADVATGSAAGVTNSSNALSVYKQTAFSDHGPDYWL